MATPGHHLAPPLVTVVMTGKTGLTHQATVMPANVPALRKTGMGSVPRRFIPARKLSKSPLPLKGHPENIPPLSCAHAATTPPHCCPQHLGGAVG